MGELSGKTILITGATDGLGRALAEDLAARGATLLLHGRDDGRGEAARREIANATGNERLHWYRVDFADLAQVRALGERLASEVERLDVLVSNAGIGTNVPGGGVRQESKDGYELRFAVNYLTGFLLVDALRPLLEATPEYLARAQASRTEAPQLRTRGLSLRAIGRALACSVAKSTVVLFLFRVRPPNQTLRAFGVLTVGSRMTIPVSPHRSFY